MRNFAWDSLSPSRERSTGVRANRQSIGRALEPSSSRPVAAAYQRPSRVARIDCSRDFQATVSNAGDFVAQRRSRQPCSVSWMLRLGEIRTSLRDADLPRIDSTFGKALGARLPLQEHPRPPRSPITSDAFQGAGGFLNMSCWRGTTTVRRLAGVPPGRMT